MRVGQLQELELGQGCYAGQSLVDKAVAVGQPEARQPCQGPQHGNAGCVQVVVGPQVQCFQACQARDGLCNSSCHLQCQISTCVKRGGMGRCKTHISMQQTFAQAQQVADAHVDASAPAY